MSDEKFLKFYREFKIFAAHTKVNDYDTLIGASNMYKKLIRYKGLGVAGMAWMLAIPFLLITYWISLALFVGGPVYAILHRKKYVQYFQQAVDRFAEEKGYAES